MRLGTHMRQNKCGSCSGTRLTYKDYTDACSESVPARLEEDRAPGLVVTDAQAQTDAAGAGLPDINAESLEDVLAGEGGVVQEAPDGGQLAFERTLAALALRGSERKSNLHEIRHTDEIKRGSVYR